MMAADEWARRLTGDDLETIIAGALADRDFESVVVALKLMAVNYPARAQAVMDTIGLGLALNRAGVDAVTLSGVADAVYGSDHSSGSTTL